MPNKRQEYEIIDPNIGLSRENYYLRPFTLFCILLCLTYAQMFSVCLQSEAMFESIFLVF